MYFFNFAGANDLGAALPGGDPSAPGGEDTPDLPDWLHPRQAISPRRHKEEDYHLGE